MGGKGVGMNGGRRGDERGHESMVKDVLKACVLKECI